MAQRHFRRADQIAQPGDAFGRELSVEVVYGMVEKDGIPLAQHRVFVDMASRTHNGRFSCNYVVDPPPAHVKTYIWFKNDEPVEAYMGSANYTQSALLSQQVEAMNPCNVDKASDLYEEVKSRSLECEHDDVETSVRIYKENNQLPNMIETTTLSFLTRAGETPTRRGSIGANVIVEIQTKLNLELGPTLLVAGFSRHARSNSRCLPMTVSRCFAS